MSTRTKIAPVLTALMDDLWRITTLAGDRQSLRIARNELRLMQGVVRAAISDPDPHHRVEAALDRLERASRGGR